MWPADLERGSPEYEALKEQRSQVLWRAVERVIPDIRERATVEMVGAQRPLSTAMPMTGKVSELCCSRRWARP